MAGHVEENDWQWGGTGKVGWSKGWSLVGRKFRMSSKVL